MELSEILEIEDQLKKGLVNNSTYDRLIPYMYFYYLYEAKKKNYKILINSEKEFRKAMDIFLTTPVVFLENEDFEIIPSLKTQTINKGILNTINYFKNIYKWEDQEKNK